MKLRLFGWLESLIQFSRYTSFRLSLSLLISVIVILAVFTAFSYKQAVRVLEEESARAMLQTIDRTSEHIDYMLDGYNDFTEIIAFDQELINKLMVLADDTNAVDQDLAEIKLEQLLRSYMYANQFASSLTLFSRDQSRVISTYPANLINPTMINNNADNIRDLDWFSSMDFSMKNTLVLDTKRKAYVSTNTNEPYFAVVRNVVDPLRPGSSLGMLLLEISTDELHNALDTFKLGSAGGYVIVSEQGNVIYASDHEMESGTPYEGEMPVHGVSNASSTTQAAGTFYSEDEDGVVQYYLYQQSQLSGWYIIGYYPRSELIGPIQSLLRDSILLALLFCAAAVFCVGVLVQRGVGKPLRHLHRVMAESETGNLDVRARFQPDNEIGDLSRTFNNMMDRISLAYYDTLTKLPNRRYLIDKIEEEIASAKSTNETLAVLFLDLDHLKAVNDTLGHHAGDLLIQSVAEILKECVNVRGTVTRIAGDEFVILLPHLQKTEQAIEAVQTIINKLREPQHIVGQEVYVTASVGVAFFPKDAIDADHLIMFADIAMYQAKKNGKNNFEIYHSSMARQ